MYTGKMNLATERWIALSHKYLFKEISEVKKLIRGCKNDKEVCKVINETNALRRYFDVDKDTEKSTVLKGLDGFGNVEYLVVYKEKA